MGDAFASAADRAAALAAFLERERKAAAEAAAAMSQHQLTAALRAGVNTTFGPFAAVDSRSVGEALDKQRAILMSVERADKVELKGAPMQAARNQVARVAQLERLEELLSAGAAAPPLADASKGWLAEAQDNAEEDARGGGSRDGAGPSSARMLVDDDASTRTRWGSGAAELGRPPPTDARFGQFGQFLHEPRDGPPPPPPAATRLPCEECRDYFPKGQLMKVNGADGEPVWACRGCLPALVEAAAARDGKGVCNDCRGHFPARQMVSCLPAGADPATAAATAGLFCEPCFRANSGLVRAPKAKAAPRKRAAGGGGGDAPAPVPPGGFFGPAPAAPLPRRPGKKSLLTQEGFSLKKVGDAFAGAGTALAGAGRAAADALTGGARRGAARAAAAAADSRGSAEAPIELGDSDDEPAGAAAAAGAPSTSVAAGAGALRGGRPRRAAAAAPAPPPLAAALAGMRCLVPPGGGPGAVELRGEDLARLAPEEFLNDSAIDARLRSLRARLEAEDPARAARFHFFNSFFYKKLTEGAPVGKKPPPLSPEAQALADDEAAASPGELSNATLTSLRAFDRVRRWTREVDVFEKDFLFIPVHDALHWSLVVGCHPGAAPPPGGAPGGVPGGGAGGGGAGEDPRDAPRPHTFLLHLDSMPRGSGHETAKAAAVVREYLRWEWRARAKAAPVSAVGRWAAAAAAAGAPPRAFDERAAPHVRPMVPRQDNSCDCGLFVCAYAEFFAAAAPRALSLAAVEALGPKGRRARGGGGGATAGDDCVDLWERGEVPAGYPSYYPGFLTLRWFEPANAGSLRSELTLDALRGLGAAAGMLDARGGFVEPPGGGWPAADAARLQALLDGIDELERGVAREGPYLSPEAYRPAAEEAKRARVAAHDARVAAAARRAAAAAATVDLVESEGERGGGGGGGGPRARPRGRASGAPDREKIAAAALARESGGRAAASEPDPDFRILLQGGGMADWSDDDVEAAPAPPRALPPPGDLAGHDAAMAAAHEQVYGAAAPARTRGRGAPAAPPAEEMDLTGADVEEEVLEEEEEAEEAAAPGGALGSEEALPPAPAPAPSVPATEPLHSVRSAGAAAGGAEEATSPPAAARARGKRKAAAEPASQDFGAAELPGAAAAPAEEVQLHSESEALLAAGPSRRAARPTPAKQPKPRGARPPPPVPPLTKQMQQKQKEKEKQAAAPPRGGGTMTFNGESLNELTAKLRMSAAAAKKK
jgi:hypothetical protein